MQDVHPSDDELDATATMVCVEIGVKSSPQSHLVIVNAVRSQSMIPWTLSTFLSNEISTFLASWYHKIASIHDRRLPKALSS